ncbi:unnamed protein product [Prunus brigantina]
MTLCSPVSGISLFTPTPTFPYEHLENPLVLSHPILIRFSVRIML